MQRVSWCSEALGTNSCHRMGALGSFGARFGEYLSMDERDGGAGTTWLGLGWFPKSNVECAVLSL